MTKQIKPLLACEVPLEQVRLPVYVSTKLDGIRLWYRDWETDRKSVV